MTGAALALGVVLLVAAAIWASRFVRHPEDIGARDHAAGGAESDQLYRGDERPAGPDAEDPSTAVPNRAEPQPPSGPALS
ncbi:MAG: hypothetical protein JWO77_2853 [Ilumatobacteraceae bacterium]|nr:hypothetical protein [Ilumatobacteraceae bacterium]